VITTLQQGIGSDKVKEWENHPSIDRFLNDPDCACLVGARTDAQVKLSNSTEDVLKQMGGPAECEISLVKRAFGPIPPTNLHNSVVVTSTSGSPLMSFYLQLQNMYGPKLLGDQSQMDPKMRQALSDLQAGIKKLVIKRSERSEEKTTPDEKDTAGIQSFHDEWNFWKEGGINPGNRSKQIAEQLEPFVKSFESLSKMADQADVFKLVDEMQEPLNAIFQDFKYPQARMEHLLAVVSAQFANHIKSNLPANLWRDNYSQVKESITRWLKFADHWIDSRKNLTDVEWRNKWGVQTPLKGEPDQLILLRKRLVEVFNLRSVYEELIRLLPPEDQRRFKLPTVLDPVAKANVLETGPYSEPKWLAMCAEVDRLLLPIEHQTAQQLKTRIFALSDRPHLLVGEFRSFRGLFTRKNVIKELQSELESLLTQLQAHIDNMKIQFDKESGSFGSSAGAPAGKNLSILVNGILWANQLRDKVKQTEDTVTNTLSSVRNADRFLAASADLGNRLREYAANLFDEWQSGTAQSLGAKDADLTLDMKGKLIDMDLKGDGDLKVHYGEKLVVLLREARQLSEMGYKVDKKIQDAVAIGEKFYRYGLKLKQISNFYNTMAEQIVDSQKGMLLMEAQKFETGPP